MEPTTHYMENFIGITKNMEKWKEYKISEVINDISMGPFGSNIKRDCYVDTGVPYLNGSNLCSVKLNEDGFNFVTEEKAKSLGRCVAKRGDIIVTHRGTIGQISYIPEDSLYETYLTGNSQFRVSVNQEIVRPDFFVYFFHTRIGQHRLLSNASQVGVPALARPTSTFRELKVPVPSMEIQNKIMNVLNSFDNKIEVNKRINDNLEQQALALFDNMFPNVASGDEMVGDMIIPKRGKGLLSKDAIEGGVPVVAGGIEPATYHNAANTKAPVLTIAASGANAGYVNLWHVPVWSSDSSYIDATMTENVYFWYVLLKKRQKEIFDAQVGSAQPHIYPKHIAEMPIRKIETSNIPQFVALVAPMFEMKGKNIEENCRLAAVRNSLLPKLMSGELKVSETNM